MYLGKREKEDAGRACPQGKQRLGAGGTAPRHADRSVWEGWKDEGIAVLLAIQTNLHHYHLDVSRTSVSFEAAFLPRLMCRFSYIPS